MITLRFINLIIPIAEIEAKYPGGWKACLKENEPFLGVAVYHDDHLLRLGAMNWWDINKVAERWAGYKFCILEAGDTPPDWLESSAERIVWRSMLDGTPVDESCGPRYVWLKGTEPGLPVGGVRRGTLERKSPAPRPAS